jgi:Tol biopolymer transport system component
VNFDGGDLRRLTNGGGNSSPHITPDGQWVVYTASSDGKPSLLRVPINGGTPVPIADGYASDPRVSPDGRLIACLHRANDSAQWQLALVHFADSSVVKSFDVPSSAAFNEGMRWMPDGTAVCYRDAANGVWRQEISGGVPQRLSGVPEEKIYSFGWSRDGKLFAFTRGREISDAVLLRNSK